MNKNNVRDFIIPDFTLYNPKPRYVKTDIAD